MNNNEFDEFMEQYSDILNMTNQEAAEIIKQVLFNATTGRGNGKTTSFIKYQTAFLKAIECLEEHPDTATEIVKKQQQHRGLRASTSIIDEYATSIEKDDLIKALSGDILQIIKTTHG